MSTGCERCGGTGIIVSTGKEWPEICSACRPNQAELAATVEGIEKANGPGRSIQLTESATQMLSDLEQFTEQCAEEVIEAALVDLTHAHAGTTPEPEGELTAANATIVGEKSFERARRRAEEPGLNVRRTLAAAMMFAMIDKLEQNRHKGDNWNADSPESLLKRLAEEGEELARVVMDGPGQGQTGREEFIENVRAEAADVANMAAMVADRCGALLPPQWEPS